MEDLRVFSNDCDLVIASSKEDATKVLCKHLGEKKEDYIDIFHWEERPHDERIAIYDDADDTTQGFTEKTAEQWIEHHGNKPQFLCSTEY